jgi:hypothetical protein
MWGFGAIRSTAAVVGYYTKLKDAEIARCRKYARIGAAEVSEWEHREYFDSL